MPAVIKRPSVISTELKPALPARRSLSEGGSEVEGWRNLLKLVLADIRPAESKAEGIDSSTPLRCARNDEREVRCARNDKRGPEALIMTSIALSTKQFFRKFILANAAGFLVISGTAAKAEFVFGEPKPVANVNTFEYGECGSSISADGLELYFRGSDSFKRTPRGYGNWDLYVAKRDSIFLPWNKPVNLGPKVNVPYHTEGPSISGDGLELYFSSSRPSAIGWTGKDTDYDIWVTTRATKDSPWEEPVNLGPVVNSSSWELFPSISSDGLELYFTSPRPGGVGGGDIYVSRRNSVNSEWQAPENLLEINDIFVDSHPDISYNGLVLYFISYHSKSSGEGYGKIDVYVSRRDTVNSQWQAPVNLGPVVNTELDESGPNISSDGLTLYFDRFFNDRIPGVRGYGASDIYQASITPIIDFNADGKVDSVDFDILNSHLGEEGLTIAYVDIYPPPFGDGRIDERDVDVFLRESVKEDGLMAHWELDEPIKIRDYNIAHERISGYDGTFHGNPISVEGKVNGAVQFDGIDDCIETPFVWDPAYGAFSAFAWVKGGNPGEVIISQKGGVFDKGIWLGLSLEGKVMTELTSGGRGSGELVSESAINNNDWHHVGVVWNGARRYLYIDGEEAAKDNGNIGQLRPLNGGLYFGAGKFLEPGSFWSGSIDEIKIYNKALSIEEIAALSGKEGAAEPVFSGENFETGDFSKFDWKFYGNADWVVSTLKKNSGNYSARAGLIYDDEKAGLELTVDCSPGDISFHRTVSSESGCDCLEFYIDGIKQDEWSGEQDWKKESFTVTSGTKTFKWVYSKDGSISEGYDSAWIDDIVFPAY